MDCNSPGSSVHAGFQAQLLEQVAIPFSRGSSFGEGSNPPLLPLPRWQADSFPLCCMFSLSVCLYCSKRKIWWQSYEETFQSGVLLTGICGRASVSCTDWMLSIDVFSLKQYAGDWGVIIKMINMYGSALRRNWQPSGELERKWLQFCRFCGLKCLPQVHVLKT